MPLISPVATSSAGSSFFFQASRFSRESAPPPRYPPVVTLLIMGWRWLNNRMELFQWASLSLSLPLYPLAPLLLPIIAIRGANLADYHNSPIPCLSLSLSRHPKSIITSRGRIKFTSFITCSFIDSSLDQLLIKRSRMRRNESNRGFAKRSCEISPSPNSWTRPARSCGFVTARSLSPPPNQIHPQFISFIRTWYTALLTATKPTGRSRRRVCVRTRIHVYI